MNSRSGFTLLEFLTAAAIMLMIGISAFFILRNQLLGNLETDSQLINERLLEAQLRAVNSLNGSPWGIHFDNTGATPSYSLFSGATYSAASSTYYLSSLVEFQTPASGTSTDVVFSKLTGTVTTSASIVIDLKSDTSQTKTISVSTQGKITVQ